MADPRGFLKLGRKKAAERPVEERVTHSSEFVDEPAEPELRAQASRCMDCGVPFCHQGCPLGNLIPEFNDHVYRGRMDEAVAVLHSTNNFPELTGRVCPAPCEASCVLNIDEAPVTIKDVERAIAIESFKPEGRALEPRVALARSGKKIAIVGSGPAGLAAAQELARLGHEVVVFERDDRVGGLARYGIPDFKLEKWVIDRRLEQLSAEGVTFRTSIEVGRDIPLAELRRSFDAVMLALGARVPRDVSIPGRELQGIYFAMDYLVQENRRVAGDESSKAQAISAKGKHVVVLGGGDTGSDCVGTANRQGAASVTQLELMPKPPLVRARGNPWPEWPLVFRTSSSQEEGCTRDFAVLTRAFAADASGQKIAKLQAARVELHDGKMVEIPGEILELPCDLVLLAMGFTGPDLGGIAGEVDLELDPRGNVVTGASGSTNVPSIFAGGDVGRGPSLVVWAIADGRRVARGIDDFLRAS